MRKLLRVDGILSELTRATRVDHQMSSSVDQRAVLTRCRGQVTRRCCGPWWCQQNTTGYAVVLSSLALGVRMSDDTPWRSRHGHISIAVALLAPVMMRQGWRRVTGAEPDEGGGSLLRHSLGRSVLLSAVRAYFGITHIIGPRPSISTENWFLLLGVQAAERLRESSKVDFVCR